MTTALKKKVKGGGASKDVTERLTATQGDNKNKKSILRGTQTRWYIKHLKSTSIFDVNREDRTAIRNKIYVSSNN